MSREQWERLDKVLTVAKDLHPRLRDIRIVLPRASQRHTDRWTLAIQALLPESIARSLCYIVSNVEHTTSRWTYRHLPGRLAILVAAPAGTLIVSYSSDSIHSWDTEYEGLKSTVIDWADKPGLPPVYASQLIPYSNIITLKGSPWKRYPNTFAIVDSEFHDIRPMSANGYEILTYVLCCSPPSIISISLDGEPEYPPRVHPTSSRLRAGSFAVSPGEGWLADWHTPGMVLVWDIVAESPTLHSRFIFPSLSAHTTPRSPDPEFLLAATFDNLEEASHSLCHLVGVSNRGAVWRWDVLTGAPVRRPWMLPHASELSSGGTSSITFSRSGLRLAWICPDRGSLGSAPSRGPSTVRVFNLSHSQPGTGGRQTRSVVLEGHDGAVNAIALTSWGDYIATASADHTVRLWRTEDGECVRTLTEHEAAVTHVLFSAYDGVLASGAEDGTIPLTPPPPRQPKQILFGAMYQVADKQLGLVAGRRYVSLSSSCLPVPDFQSFSGICTLLKSMTSPHLMNSLQTSNRYDSKTD
ncbi:WD40-repeat-containing domain protein [Daedaleopsis nitida]|nr:WD40-repeat-containing domain protein [Daedaleopsis nitida]